MYFNTYKNNKLVRFKRFPDLETNGTNFFYYIFIYNLAKTIKFLSSRNNSTTFVLFCLDIKLYTDAIQFLER